MQLFDINCKSVYNYGIKTTKGDVMDFQGTLINIQNYLDCQHTSLSEIGIDNDDFTQVFDAILIKKLAASNTLADTGASNQTHIALTSNEMDIFPYIANHRYLEADDIDKNFKRFFVLRIPVVLSNNNIEFLKNGYVSSPSTGFISTHTSTARSRRSDNSYQQELSYLQFDGKEFLDFRKLLKTGDYLIILKFKGDFKYLILGLKENRAEEFRLGEKTSCALFSKSMTGVTLDEYIQDAQQEYTASVNCGRNVIVYGAPGTGKSKLLDEEGKKYHKAFRVTFHPEYTYFDFVGSYKPTPIYENITAQSYVSLEGVPLNNIPGKPTIDYTFVPGPFTLALIEAFNNLDKGYLFIIEELNRANTAAVFGDLFQLLDRTDDGESEYPISSAREMISYIKAHVKNYNKDTLIIPSNLALFATMNSADQGVFVMDSAFKRRWEFEYIPIDYSIVKHKHEKVKYNQSEICWSDFAIAINNKLGNMDINEDKFIGPYFLKPGEPNEISAVASKLLIYLWDDVVKYKRNEFFKYEFKTFSDLIKGYEGGKAIFNFEIVNNTMDNNLTVITEKTVEPEFNSSEFEQE